MTSTSTDPRAIAYDPGRVVNSTSANAAGRHHDHPPRRLSVADVMTVPAATIESDAPLLEAVQRLISLGGDELVVTVGQRPAGVITPRRVLALLDPAYAHWRPRCAVDLIPGRTSKLLPDLDATVAAQRMLSEHVDALPVVDYRGDLLGVLSHRQLISHLDDLRRSA